VVFSSKIQHFIKTCKFCNFEKNKCMQTAPELVPFGNIPVMPDQWGEEKNENWAKKNASFIITQANPVVLTPQQISQLNQNEAATLNSGRFWNKCQRNVSYFMAEQINGTYSHWIRDFNNRALPARLINGQSIYRVTSHIRGYMFDNFVADLHRRIVARNESPDYISEVEERIALMELKIQMEKQGATPEGVEFNPLGPDIQTAQDLQNFKQKKPLSALERMYTGLSRTLLLEIKYVEKFKEIIDSAVINSFPSVHYRVKNGQIFLDVIPETQVIYDTASCSESGEEDRYKAYYEYLSIPQLFELYEFTDTEKAELQNIAKANSAANAINSGYAFVGERFGYNNYWYQWNNGVPVVARVVAYWKTIVDNKETIYQAHYIGNKYIKDFGQATNMPEQKEDLSKVCYPIIQYRPDMKYGKNISLVDRLFTLSDRIEALKAKKDLFINKAKGPVLILNGSLGQDGASTKEILSDMASLSFVQLDMDMDEAISNYGKERVVEVVDLGVSPKDIEVLNQEIENLEQEIKAIAFTPDAVLGQQTPQGSSKELINIQQQAAYGTAAFYAGFVEYLKRIIQYGVDVAKIVYSQQESEKTLRFDENELILMKFSKEMILDRIGIYLDQSDVVTPADRAEWSQIMFNFSQNPQNYKGLNLADFAKIKTMKSNYEISSYLQARSEEEEAKEAARIEREQALAAMQQRQNLMTQQNLAGMNQIGAMVQKQMDADMQQQPPA
jgi:uncharacterized protein YfeS